MNKFINNSKQMNNRQRNHEQQASNAEVLN